MIRAHLRNMVLGGVIGLIAPLVATAQDAPDVRPKRVVSINLCTDQLAMMLADPGQLVSVSVLAREPESSAMADEALGWPINHARAEEIFLLKPDLVVAGAFSSQATVQMLRKLGLPVEVFEPALSLEDVSAAMTRMGAALHQDARAADQVAGFEARLAALREQVVNRPRAAIYYANGYSVGDQSLSGHILATAGFDNIAREAGIPVAGNIPLEVLALLDPDVIITGQRYPAASRSEEILDHPVVRHLQDARLRGTIADRDWICGTPHVLRAVEGLIGLRHDYEAVARGAGE
ncbi:ABC transporter substrate-binding protein [Aliiroseovarius sediminis]|uniref:ABC transporter substrate-binding protein n=1 Tax=Aliiroseovarius sediminis TaxID=2925839 RepID=UPI001F57EC20|nr:ABC transporter substrate-binding protein [Aliiroseovarius sediminis]MCI2393814.1 ABC transporter substrate-binding protein [Aliiroseovarius sediminis]